MPLLAADTFLHAVHTFRAVWFQGRYGGGKTLLAVHVGRVVSKRFKGKFDSYSLVSNIAADGYTAVSDLDFVPKSSVIVYDESWMSLGQGTSAKTIQAYMAFLRKVDYILLMPSVLELSRYGYLIWCERIFNFGPLGVPLWVYQWGMRGKKAKESGGTFFFLRPQSVFGTYDTLSQPYDLTELFTDDIESRSRSRAKEG